MCSKTRCRQCKKGKVTGAKPELGPCFTHGQYMEWKKKKKMKRVPVVDLGECTDCDSCIELCPGFFKRNKDTGFIEVTECLEYPEDVIDEAISVCPADCIAWE